MLFRLHLVRALLRGLFNRDGARAVLDFRDLPPGPTTWIVPPSATVIEILHKGGAGGGRISFDKPSDATYLEVY